MYCPTCGAANDDNAWKCTTCGRELRTSVPVATTDSTMGGLIPTGNPKSLWAYYLGLFSLLPCIGIATGIPALIFGLQALKAVKERPEIKGRNHALVGVIIGGGCALIWTLGALVALVAAVTEN